MDKVSKIATYTVLGIVGFTALIILLVYAIVYFCS